MLSFDVPDAARWLLQALLALWAALLVGGLLLGKLDASRRSRLPLPLRLALSATLLAAAVVWWLAGTGGTPLDRYGLWIVLGMALGLLGDLFMAGLVVAKPRNVFFGMAAFGAGHVCYMLAFVQAARVLGLGPRPAWLGPLLLYLAAAAPFWLLLVRNPARGPALNYGTLGYSLLLAAMASMALALALHEAAFVPLAVGGLLFMASDLILGSELMRQTHFPSIGDVIWTTYTVAQALVVYSSASALYVLRQ